MLFQQTKDERLRNIIAAGADPYVGKRELAALRGVSPRTIERLVAQGKIPKPELIGLRKVGWRLSVVNSLAAT
jgi:predicted DNA-binding transcriptional regulator AlpA